jgi:histidine phosphotransferase ChpT
LLIACQTIPRGGSISVAPISDRESMGFQIAATGPNARIPQAIPALLEGASENGALDAHAIQPFYAGLLARACGLRIELKAEPQGVLVVAN